MQSGYCSNTEGGFKNVFELARVTVLWSSERRSGMVWSERGSTVKQCYTTWPSKLREIRSDGDLAVVFF